LRLPPAGFVVGFGCADLSGKNKNFAGLLAALRALPDKRGLQLVAFGQGRPPEMPEDLPTIFLGGITSARLQSIFYSALDVFVMPSRMETFGLTALEAMACGTPVVAYQTGGIPDFVENSVTGLLAPNIDDPSGLTERLTWLQEHPQQRIQMGLAARDSVERRFTQTIMAENYFRLYSKILELPAPVQKDTQNTPHHEHHSNHHNQPAHRSHSTLRRHEGLEAHRHRRQENPAL
jgi:glycosyltransferase involved in cell wall biosynthesis